MNSPKGKPILNVPLLVALTYADERLFKPDVPSSPPSICKTRDKETIVLNNSVIIMSSFAEHSKTLTLQIESKINFLSHIFESVRVMKYSFEQMLEKREKHEVGVR